MLRSRLHPLQNVVSHSSMEKWRVQLPVQQPGCTTLGEKQELKSCLEAHPMCKVPETFQKHSPYMIEWLHSRRLCHLCSGQSARCAAKSRFFGSGQESHSERLCVTIKRTLSALHLKSEKLPSTGYAQNKSVWAEACGQISSQTHKMASPQGNKG
jgi:hypothetical protein